MYVSNNEVAVIWTVCFTPHLEVEKDHLRTSPVLAVAGTAVGLIQEVVLVGVNLKQKTTWCVVCIARLARFEK